MVKIVRRRLQEQEGPVRDHHAMGHQRNRSLWIEVEDDLIKMTGAVLDQHFYAFRIGKVTRDSNANVGEVLVHPADPAGEPKFTIEHRVKLGPVSESKRSLVQLEM